MSPADYAADEGLTIEARDALVEQIARCSTRASFDRWCGEHWRQVHHAEADTPTTRTHLYHLARLARMERT